VQRRDHVLMFVVRKLDRELPFVFWFGRLIGIVRLAEAEARIFARRSAQMTDDANRRTRCDKGLAREKLLPVATDTRFMIGKVSNVWEFSFGGPGSWNFVTRAARQILVVFRRMQEMRVLVRSSPRRLWLRYWSRGTLPLTSLCGGQCECTSRQDQQENGSTDHKSSLRS